jgi:hypothetical protein
MSVTKLKASLRLKCPIVLIVIAASVIVGIMRFAAYL